jgi:lysophospholipase L1-like esterase
MARVESANWIIDRKPGKAGINKETLSWDLSNVVTKLPEHPNWFRIELVTQGDRSRTIYASNLRAEGGGARKTVELKNGAPPAGTAAPEPPADGPIPYPDPKNEAAWPGKGPIRSFGYMVGERRAFWLKRQADQGAIVFVGDSLTGGWKTLAKDFPGFKVANRGVGGDVSRGALFRFKADVLALNPKAIVIEIGNNDLTAFGSPADMLSNLADMVAMAEKEKPGTPVILCSIPPSANPKAPIKPESRQAMNEGIRKMAAAHKDTSFCDLYAALANPDGSPKLENYFEDKLHMNDAGHAKWAALLIPIFEKLKLQ